MLKKIIIVTIVIVSLVLSFVIINHNKHQSITENELKNKLSIKLNQQKSAQPLLTDVSEDKFDISKVFYYNNKIITLFTIDIPVINTKIGGSAELTKESGDFSVYALGVGTNLSDSRFIVIGEKSYLYLYTVNFRSKIDKVIAVINQKEYTLNKTENLFFLCIDQSDPDNTLDIEWRYFDKAGLDITKIIQTEHGKLFNL